MYINYIDFLFCEHYLIRYMNRGTSFVFVKYISVFRYEEYTSF
jgi:hypothetical protein